MNYVDGEKFNAIPSFLCKNIPTHKKQHPLRYAVMYNIVYLNCMPKI